MLLFAAVVAVSDAATLRTAVETAKTGDEIVLADGSYAVSGENLRCKAAGPIVVRAATPLGAKIELATLEGFVVTGTSWHFDGLDIKGVCAADKDCEHAFHVSGAATDFTLRKSRIVDFNAQLKVNASAGGAGIPHAGVVEGNELFDTHPRDTDSPVTKLNIDTGDGWIVRGNYIHDYRRKDGNPTYGAFMKSGGKNGLFERNLVLCTKDQPETGVQIGLSFGGGGTGAEFCAPAFDPGVPCLVEHENGVMRNNIIAHCSDVAIYLNQAKSTKVLYNTLVGTSGIDFRFKQTSGEARGNVLSGKIRDRNEATHTEGENVVEVTAETFAAMYAAPLAGDLKKKGDLAAILGKGTARSDMTDDYCARTRTGAWDLGALQASLGDCVTTTPAPSPGDGGASTPADAGGGNVGGSSSSGSVPNGSGDGGAAPVGASPAEDGGCGCRAAPVAGTGPFALVLAAFAALTARRGARGRARPS